MFEFKIKIVFTLRIQQAKIVLLFAAYVCYTLKTTQGSVLCRLRNVCVAECCLCNIVALDVLRAIGVSGFGMAAHRICLHYSLVCSDFWHGLQYRMRLHYSSFHSD